MVRKHLKKIIIGGVVAVCVIITIVLFTPITYSTQETIPGIYHEAEYVRGQEVNDNVSIQFDGKFQKKNKLWNTDMEFIGTVSVEFEEHPEMNFQMESQNLIFSYQGNGMYRYTIDFQEKMYDCVNSINLKKEWNNMYFCMEIDHNWKNYEAWWAQEESQEEIQDHEYVWANISAPATNAEEFNLSLEKAHEVD